MARKDAAEKRNTQQRSPISGSWWVWWLLSIALLTWSFFNLVNAHAPGPAAIPYSTFLNQVRSDNVRRVHITGSTITGDLSKPILWPPKAAAPKQTNSSQA